MPKAARNDKPRLSNIDIANYAKRWEQLENEADEVKAEKKDLAAEMKAGGVSMREFRAAMRQVRKPVEEEFKATVNSYLAQAGQGELFV